MSGILYVLNGPCSCGKTSTAKILQNLLSECSMLLGVDAYHLAVPSDKLNFSRCDPDYFTIKEHTKDGKPYLEVQHGPRYKAIDRARFLANCQFLEQGISIVADELFWTKEEVLAFLQGYKEQRVFLFGLHVSDAEGERRERSRGGNYDDDDSENFTSDSRPQGLSRASETMAHQFMKYDLEIDTSDLQPDAVAQLIIETINSDPEPRAFKQLLERNGI